MLGNLRNEDSDRNRQQLIDNFWARVEVMQSASFRQCELPQCGYSSRYAETSELKPDTLIFPV